MKAIKALQMPDRQPENPRYWPSTGDVGAATV
jgi:hypothetical protein